MTDRDPLNFFSPYERLPAGHENQLTRALLVLLRMSPIAHIEWLRLIAPERRLADLPPASYVTQRRAVRHSTEGDEQAELISVFLAPERPQSGGGEIAESDRGQVLDGIIEYGELVVVIENKVFDADDFQARRLNLTGARIALASGQEAVVVLWRDLLERLIALRERNLIAGAEAVVLEDFLTYVENHFPELGPFRNLALCGGVATRQLRRLRQVLSDATRTEASESGHGPWVPSPAPDVIGAKVYLRIDDDESGIEFRIYPADTLAQARVFYSNENAVRGLRELASMDEWEARPNFHFGYMQPGYCWTEASIELDAYLDLWQEQIRETGAIPRDDWDKYWTWLVQHGIADAEDRSEFDQRFTQTARPTATPRPGLCLGRGWSLAEAEQLDARGAFAAAVRDALETVLRAFGEAPLGGRR